MLLLLSYYVFAYKDYRKTRQLSWFLFKP